MPEVAQLVNTARTVCGIIIQIIRRKRVSGMVTGHCVKLMGSINSGVVVI